MNSNWVDQAVAIFVKEWRTEARSRHGLFSAGLFGVLAVVAMAFSTFVQRPTPTLAAAMLTVAVLFAAVIGLPRTMLVEDEQRTFELLIRLADPGAAFFGKAVYNAVQMAFGSMLLGTMFVMLTGVDVASPGTFYGSLVLLALALAAGISLCGALVIGAANRWILVGAVAMPLLIPLVFLGVGAVGSGLGSGNTIAGIQSMISMGCYALTLFAVGPTLAGAVWRSD